MQKVWHSILDKDTISLYWELLKEYTAMQFSFATNQLVKTFKPTSACPFPAPAHFVEFCDVMRHSERPENKLWISCQEDLPTEEERSEEMRKLKEIVSKLCKKVKV
jgi:hypothetical protein